MSKVHRSHSIRVQPDVFGLFSGSVGSFSANVGLSALIFSDNLGTKRRCYRAERFMFSGYYSYRRLSKDYEYLPESREAMIYLAMSRLMLRRLARQAPYGVPSPQRQGLRGLARAF